MSLKFFVGTVGFFLTVLIFSAVTVTEQPFGKVPDQQSLMSQETKLFTISNSKMEVKVTDLGASIQSIIVPNESGSKTDILLGYDNAEGYLNDINTVKTFFGCVPARFANRIKDGIFSLDGKEYKLNLIIDDQGNALHSGPFVGLIWNSTVVKEKNKAGVRFSLLSPDSYWGFPGNLFVIVEYLLDNHNNLYVEYKAISDKNTVLNLTNHSYFNLNGQGTGSILDNVLKISSNEITETDKYSIPTGKYIDVKGTPFDFTQYNEIGKNIKDDNLELKNARGYDFNWVLKKNVASPKDANPELINDMHLAAEVYSTSSGVKMSIYTTQPGIQFYSGNFLPKTDKISGKNGTMYGYRDGFALETQHYPNSPNVSSFPTTTLLAGKLFHEESVYHFSVKK